ncbi:MAG: SulP family inorganic anion transporter [Xanthobacteraceae bacterium]|nr:SulP family inorganic anion transporter [Xanthobacteraceae bacterium]
MAASGVELDRTFSNKKFRAALTDVFAGTICSVLSIAYCLSYAALIFTGPLDTVLSYGVAVTFLSAAIGGAIVAWRSSLPFTIAGPDSSVSVVMAAMVATLVHRLATHGGTELLAPTLIAMSLTTALTGLLLCILGFTNAGRAIRFIPFPVIGGFLGATGWLMIMGAAQVVTDQQPALTNVGAFVDGGLATKLAAALIVAVALHLALRRSKHPFVLPGVLLTAFVATYVAMWLTGFSFGDAQAQGWMFRPRAAAGLIAPWQPGALRGFSWTALPALAGDLLAVMFVTVINLLLNTTGIEIATRTEANIERDLKAVGFANIVTAAFGGYVSCTSLSRSLLVRSVGATSRISGFTVAAVSAAMLVAGPSFLGYVPKYVLAGLLMFLGAGLVYQWLIQSARQLLRIDYLSLLAIALLIVNVGFIAGVLIGVVIGCATFALSASRVNAIKFGFDGSEYRSSLDRSRQELALLTNHGREIQGMALQSYLFFGSANRLYQHVKALLNRQPGCRFVIFDFRRVTGIDSSATQSFAQIKQAATEAGACIILVNLTPELERPFRSARLISDDVTVASDLDRALETCEHAIIEAHRAEVTESRSLRLWMAEALSDAQLADRLVEHCRRLEVQPGDIIARQGDPAASMHFILEGRVGIIVDLPDGRTMRVRSLGEHTTVGEMGLITRSPRSATIQAETASVLYELDADAFERIKIEQPQLSQALFAYVVKVMAERLSLANRVIGILQR